MPASSISLSYNPMPPHPIFFRATRLGLLLTGCLILTACSISPPAPPLDSQDLTHLLAGELALHRGQNQQASEHFLASAKNTQNPDIAKRATYAGQLSNQADTYKQASQAWAHLQPDAILAQQHLAQSLFKNGENNSAKEILRDLIKAHPDYLPAPTIYAEILFAEGAYKQADTFLTPYTQKWRPDRLLASIHIQTLSQLQHLDRAIALIDRLIHQHPSDTNLLLSAGVLYMEVGLEEQAQEHFLLALKQQPDNSQAHYYLAQSYLQTNDSEKAAKHFALVTDGPNVMLSKVEQLSIDQPLASETGPYFDQLRSDHPLLSAQLYLLQADYLKTLQQFDAALEAYAEGVIKHPHDTDLRYGIAMLASYMVNWPLAEEHLLEIIKLDPNHANALNALGYTYADHNTNLKQADIYIKRAFALKPDDPAIKDSMGWLAFRQGHYRIARNYLQQAFAEFPDAEVAAHLGVVEWALGNIQQAQEIWQSILQDDPDNALIKQAILDAKKEFPNDGTNQS